MSISLFENNVKQLWGNAGIAWLKELPSIVAFLAKHWHLTDLVFSANLSYNYILLGCQHAKPVALKIGFDRTVIQQEKAALQTYNGHGCVQLLDAYFEYNALLLEQIIPGTSLKSFFPNNDDRALEHTVSVMQQLHAAPVVDDKKFKSIQDWLALLDTPPAVVANNYHIKEVRVLSRELIATQEKVVLLHGDLHHDNILQADGGWKAIDPKGVLGEAAYEVGDFIRNPYPLLLQQPDPRQIMHKRLKLFAELLGFSEDRLHAWSYVQAVLAGCWALQDGQDDPEVVLAEAELLKI